MDTRPEVVSAEGWRAARVELLAKEKEFTRARDVGWLRRHDQY
jgi:predicted dithiol-disulfide oxidoreductase (DUF899 family)